MEVGQTIHVELVDFHRVDEGSERALITDVCDGSHSSLHETHSLCYIEWVDRPLIHQRNGSFRPFNQVWVPNHISAKEGADA